MPEMKLGSFTPNITVSELNCLKCQEPQAQWHVELRGKELRLGVGLARQASMGAQGWRWGCYEDTRVGRPRRGRNYKGHCVCGCLIGAENGNERMSWFLDARLGLEWIQPSFYSLHGVALASSKPSACKGPQDCSFSASLFSLPLWALPHCVTGSNKTHWMKWWRTPERKPMEHELTLTPGPFPALLSQPSNCPPAPFSHCWLIQNQNLRICSLQPPPHYF